MSQRIDRAINFSAFLRPHLRKPVAVVAASVAVAGCVRLHWSAQYIDAEANLSVARSVAVDGQGNTYAGGYLTYETSASPSEERSSFLTKYASNGQILWEKRFATGNLESVQGVSRVVVDQASNAYAIDVAVREEPFQVFLSVVKIDTSGNELWRWSDEVPGVLPNDLRGEIRADGNLYISGSPYGESATDVAAISPAGDRVWAWQPATTTLSDPSEYPGFVASAAVPGERAVVTHNFGWKLDLVNASGRVISSFTSAQLGVTNVSSAMVQSDAVLVSGFSAKGFVVRRINPGAIGYEVDAATERVFEDQFRFAGLDSGGFCFAQFRAGAIETGRVDGSGSILWKKTHAQDTRYPVALEHVRATNSRCATQYYVGLPGEERASVMVENSATGQRIDRIDTPKFGPYDMTLSGASVVQAGIGESVDGSQRVSATIFNHRVF